MWFHTIFNYMLSWKQLSSLWRHIHVLPSYQSMYVLAIVSSLLQYFKIHLYIRLGYCNKYIWDVWYEITALITVRQTQINLNPTWANFNTNMLHIYCLCGVIKEYLYSNVPLTFIQYYYFILNWLYNLIEICVHCKPQTVLAISELLKVWFELWLAQLNHLGYICLSGLSQSYTKIQ